MSATTLLFAEDLARIWKVSPRQARRRLETLEREHGSKIVGRFKGRRGMRRYTTAGALALLGPAIDGGGEKSTSTAFMNLIDRISALEDRMSRIAPAS
jgi:hypothetical protein